MYLSDWLSGRLSPAFGLAFGPARGLAPKRLARPAEHQRQKDIGSVAAGVSPKKNKNPLEDLAIELALVVDLEPQRSTAFISHDRKSLP